MRGEKRRGEERRRKETNKVQGIPREKVLSFVCTV